MSIRVSVSRLVLLELLRLLACILVCQVQVMDEKSHRIPPGATGDVRKQGVHGVHEVHEGM